MSLVFCGVVIPFGKSLCAQREVGSIRGVVTDKDTDTPLPGATVTVVETGKKVQTQGQGNFVLTQVPIGKYTLVVTKDGYARQVRAEVVVAASKLTEVSVALAAEITDLDELLVQDILKAGAGSEIALLQARFTSAALMDSVGSELMSRAHASDAASALRLVAGASVQDGKSPVIRGLPDRYVSSQMNGVRLPTADENKRAVELDQFPAAVIESIRVSKTFTPDQQGDASGGAVDVRLKGIPEEELFFKVKGQVSRNTQSPGQGGFLSYEGGGLDTLGKDDSRKVQTDRIGSSWLGAVGTSTTDAPTDYKLSASGGGRHELDNGWKVGGFGSLFYERSSAFYDNGIDDSYWVERPGAPMSPRTSQGTPSQGSFKTALFDVTQGKQTLKWGSLATLGAESKNHALSLTYLYTHTAEDTATLAEDTRGKQYYFPGYDPSRPNTPGHEEPDAAPYLRLETLTYTERTTQTLQLHGRHAFPIGDTEDAWAPELDWTLAHSSADLIEPDKRQFGELWIPGRRAGPILIPATHYPYKPSANFTLGNVQRIFKDIEEESDQYAVNVKLPFESFTERKGYAKLGIFHDDLTRKFDQDTFSNFNDNSKYEGPWEQHWSKAFPNENHPITDSTYDVDYKGKQKIGAYYGMVDVPLFPFLDVIGGVRFESTSLDIVNNPEANATWFPPGSLVQTELHPGDGDVSFRRHDTLPSIALVGKPIESVTLRASYNETVARQTFKELTPIIQQEYLGGPVFIGNPELEISSIQNYDLRCDYAPYQGALLSASWFKKDIDKPIEYVQRIASFDFTTAVNYPKGRLTGWELEGRQALGNFWDALSGLSVGANATFIDSKVILPAEDAAEFELPNIKAPMTSRDMTNAPEHLYNVFLTYDLAETKTQLALFYTVQGDTLVAGAGQSLGNFVPNVYAKEYDTLNASMSQGLGKYVSLNLAAKNLTDPKIMTVYRSQYIGEDITKTSYTKGIELVLGIGGEIRF